MESRCRLLHHFVLFSARFLNGDNLTAVVIAASLAHSVSQLHLAALRAFGHAGQRELPMGVAALVATGFRNLSLRYCHGGYTSYSIFSICLTVLCALVLIRVEQGRAAAKRGSICFLSQSQSTSLRSAPQCGQRPLQSSLHRYVICTCRINAGTNTSAGSTLSPVSTEKIVLFLPSQGRPTKSYPSRLSSRISNGFRQRAQAKLG